MIYDDKTAKTIKMPNDLIEQIEKLAYDNERNFSTQVIFMLKQYIKFQEQK